MYIQWRFGDRGVSAVATYANFDTIPRAFGGFMNAAATSQIAALFGARRSNEAAQVLADLLRIGLLISILLPLALIPALKPAARWFGAGADIVDHGYTYCLPMVLSTACPVFALLFGGALLGEGRALLFAVVQVSTMVLNIGVFDPIFMFLTPANIAGAAYGTTVGDLIPLVVIATLYFKGKFSVKPQWRDLFRRFSPNTWPAVRVGLSQLFSQLSFMIPTIILRKFVGMSCGADVPYVAVVNGFNAQVRWYQVTLIVIADGFLSCGSYAFSAGLHARGLHLLVHALWLSGVWVGVNVLLLVAVPETAGRIFGESAEALQWAAEMLRNANVAAIVLPFIWATQAMLQAMGNEFMRDFAKLQFHEILVRLRMQTCSSH
jgi:Na+-driven multidrug efflux pump